MSDDLGKKIVDRKGNIHNRDDWFSQQEAERLYKILRGSDLKRKIHKSIISTLKMLN